MLKVIKRTTGPANKKSTGMLPMNEGPVEKTRLIFCVLFFQHVAID